ncbi:MAG TPA: multidrug effflux MFS transporter [Pseudomonadales bacterium]|nr:multidrug effflux MFS transporter [Pseudomonadales bacterium]
MNQRTDHSFKLLALLVLVSMVGPLATAIYMPAFPAMAEAFDVGPDQIQLTLTAYMLGLAISQLFCGAFADRFGRRPVMHVSLIIFAIGSLASIFADSVGSLILFRTLQALGASTGMVLGRAIIRDIYSPAAGLHALSIVSSTVAIVPTMAPLIGGYLVGYAGWQSTFVFLLVVGLITLAVSYRALPETLRPEHVQSMHPERMMRNFWSILKHREFLAYALPNGTMLFIHYAFLSSASFILIDVYGVSEIGFGVYYLMVNAGYISGTMLGTKWRSKGFNHSVGLSAFLLFFSALANVFFNFAEWESPFTLCFFYSFGAFGAGLLMPVLVNGALHNFPEKAGTASSLMGCVQMLGGAFGSGLLGAIYDNSARPMVIVITLCTALMFALYYGLMPKPTYSADK